MKLRHIFVGFSCGFILCIYCSFFAFKASNTLWSPRIITLLNNYLQQYSMPTFYGVSSDFLTNKKKSIVPISSGANINDFDLQNSHLHYQIKADAVQFNGSLLFPEFTVLNGQLNGRIIQSPQYDTHSTNTEVSTDITDDKSNNPLLRSTVLNLGKFDRLSVKLSIIDMLWTRRLKIKEVSGENFVLYARTQCKVKKNKSLKDTFQHLSQCFKTNPKKMPKVNSADVLSKLEESKESNNQSIAHHNTKDLSLFSAKYRKKIIDYWLRIVDHVSISNIHIYVNQSNVLTINDFTHNNTKKTSLIHLSYNPKSIMKGSSSLISLQMRYGLNAEFLDVVTHIKSSKSIDVSDSLLLLPFDTSIRTKINLVDDESLIDIGLVHLNKIVVERQVNDNKLCFVSGCNSYKQQTNSMEEPNSLSIISSDRSPLTFLNSKKYTVQQSSSKPSNMHRSLFMKSDNAAHVKQAVFIFKINGKKEVQEVLSASNSKVSSSVVMNSFSMLDIYGIIREGVVNDVRLKPFAFAVSITPDIKLQSKKDEPYFLTQVPNNLYKVWFGKRFSVGFFNVPFNYAKSFSSLFKTGKLRKFEDLLFEGSVRDFYLNYYMPNSNHAFWNFESTLDVDYMKIPLNQEYVALFNVKEPYHRIYNANAYIVGNQDGGSLNIKINHSKVWLAKKYKSAPTAHSKAQLTWGGNCYQMRDVDLQSQWTYQANRGLNIFLNSKKIPIESCERVMSKLGASMNKSPYVTFNLLGQMPVLRSNNHIFNIQHDKAKILTNVAMRNFSFHHINRLMPKAFIQPVVQDWVKNTVHDITSTDINMSALFKINQNVKPAELDTALNVASNLEQQSSLSDSTQSSQNQDLTLNQTQTKKYTIQPHISLEIKMKKLLFAPMPNVPNIHSDLSKVYLSSKDIFVKTNKAWMEDVFVTDASASLSLDDQEPSYKNLNLTFTYNGDASKGVSKLDYFVPNLSKKITSILTVDHPIRADVDVIIPLMFSQRPKALTDSSESATTSTKKTIDVDAQVDLVLDNNKVHLKPLDMTYESLSGHVSFDLKKGVRAKSLQLRLDNQPVTASLWLPRSDNNNSFFDRVELSAYGKFSINPLKPWLTDIAHYFPKPIEGNVDLVWPFDGRSKLLDIQLDLKRKDIKWPAPFQVKSKTPLNMNVKIMPSGFYIDGQYNNQYVFDIFKGTTYKPWTLKRGSITKSVSQLRTLKHELNAVVQNVDTVQIDSDQLYDNMLVAINEIDRCSLTKSCILLPIEPVHWINTLSQSKENSTAKKTAFDIQSLQLLMSLKNISLFDFKFDDTNLLFHHDEQLYHSYVDVLAKNSKLNLILPFDFWHRLGVLGNAGLSLKDLNKLGISSDQSNVVSGSNPIDLKLSKLNLNDVISEGKSDNKKGQLKLLEDFKHIISGIDPRLPAINIECDTIIYNDRNLGSLRAQARFNSNGFSVDNITASMLSIDSKLKYQWIFSDLGALSFLEGKATAQSLTPMLSYLGYEQEFIHSSHISSNFALRWSGLPWDIRSDNIQGHGIISFQKGHLVSSSQVVTPMQALGLMNVQLLQRRLKLDFKDVFSSGIVYDTIDGSFNLNNEKLEIQYLNMSGPTLEFTLFGVSDLKEKTIHQTMKGFLPLSDQLAVPAAAVGGVAGFATYWVLDKLFGEAINEIATFSLELEGPISNPQTSNLRFFE